MKLNLDRLTTSPETFEFEGAAEWWNRRRSEEHDPLQTGEAFQFRLEAHTMAEDVYIDGEMSGVVEAECGRCLARYRHALRETYRLVLGPARGRRPSDPEGVEALARDGLWLGDELEAGWYQGSEIDLDRFFSEIVALSLPVQPLCAEDCAGLCPSCGENRNQVACGCEQIKPTSPFAALEVLRKG